MKKLSVALPLLGVVINMVAPSAHALVLCYNTKTKTISALTTCPASSTQLNGSNLPPLLGLKAGSTTTPTPSPGTTSVEGLSYSKCYKQTATASGAQSNGKLGVAVACKQKTEVMIASGFTTTDNSNAGPALSSQTVLFNGTLPNGVQFETTGISNQFYRLDATITCCPKI